MSRQIIKKGSTASVAILISRITGFIRDMLLSRFVGGGAIMSAWVLAFRIPNTLRMFFGEGAATQAIIPMIGHMMQGEGKEKARQNLGIILGTVALILLLICILISIIGIIFLPFFKDVIRVHYALLLLPILMPYSIFICLSAICMGMLNVLGKFFFPYLSSVILNSFEIFAILIFYKSEPVFLVYCLSWAVLLSGLIQLVGMLYLLKKCEMFPYPIIPKLWNHPIVKEFFQLTIPGLIGAAVMQLDVLIDSFIAIYIGNYAAPALYYTERLIYLPVGIFAVALGNASLVTMSKYAAEKNYHELTSSLRYSLKHIYYITIPIVAYYLIFRYPILSLVYGGHRFGSHEISETAWAMLFFSMGIPAFCAVKIVLSCYYSQKDMKTPLKVAIFCIGVNIVLNLILMYPLRQGGIALATTISAILNNTILLQMLRTKLKNKYIFQIKIFKSLAKTIAVSIIAAFGSWWCFSSLHKISFIAIMDWRNLISLSLATVIFSVIFILINFLLKSEEQKEWTILGKKLLNKIFTG